eukprot:2205402-Lingulodinium_polyedra.AAC.1
MRPPLSTRSPLCPPHCPAPPTPRGRAHRARHPQRRKGPQSRQPPGQTRKLKPRHRTNGCAGIP